MLVEGTDTGHFRTRVGKGKTDTAFFINNNYSYHRTTHPTNAPTPGARPLTATGNGVFNEIKATRVEGNIFEFEAVEAGEILRMYDSAGNLVPARHEAPSTVHALFDTGGDDVPGAKFIEDSAPTCTARTPGSTDRRSARPSPR